MKTVVVSASDNAVVGMATGLLAEGRVIAFPTDTVYGVGCDVNNAEAIEALYQVKQRPRHMAIPVLVSDLACVERVAVIGDAAESLARLAEAFWPGALTVVLKAKGALPAVLLAGRDTVAVRMPNHAFARRLIRQVGGALAVSSANLSGQDAPRDAVETLAQLEGRVPLVIDGGRCKVGVASTIVDLTGVCPRVLRHGGLGAHELERVLPGLASAQ